MVYYNDVDPEKCAWMRELIKHGHIPKGEVDERSIRDIKPGELAGYKQCHFFAGIGGWALALRWAGWPDDREIWTGSCPCQPFSGIGERKGIEDERHLWPTFDSLIDARRPAITVGEQVASPDGLGWLDGVFSDLEGKGYACEAFDLCSAGIGSPTIRQRLYWVGNSFRQGLEGHTGDDGSHDEREEATRPDTKAGSSSVVPTSLDALPVLRGIHLHDSQGGARPRLRLPTDRGVHGTARLRPLYAEYEALACADGWRRVQPGTFPMAHGVPGRMGLLRGYGDAIHPEVASRFIQAIMQSE